MSTLPLYGEPVVRELRDYQAQAIDLLRASLKAGKKRPILQAPTGYGKTRVASELVRMALDKGNRVVFCVPAVDLIEQTLESFWNDGIADIGVIQANHIATDWARPVQIASVQTLMRRSHPKASLVIIDEVHRWFDFYGRWMRGPNWVDVPFIGLSATPWTKGLGKHFDDLIVSATTQQLIDQGYLSKFRVFAPSHPDLSDVKIVAGDYHEGQLSDAMNKAPLVADVVETWLRCAENRPTLCFGVDRAHAKHLQRSFETAGVRAGYQDAHTPKEDRAEIRRKFHSGEYKVVCNVGTLTTGVDWDVRCIILARPTRSEMLYVQIIGRGLRTASGKEDCLILDHSDTTLRLGFVTDIQHDVLDDGKKGAREQKHRKPTPKECPKCKYLRPAKVSICPSCGFKPEAVSDIEVTDGQLVELSGNGLRERAEKRTIKLRQREIPLGEFYGQLKRYAIERRYNPHWADHKFREAIGVWPNAYKSAPDRPVVDEVASWIKSRIIAFAKRKGGGDAATPA